MVEGCLLEGTIVPSVATSKTPSDAPSVAPSVWVIISLFLLILMYVFLMRIYEILGGLCNMPAALRDLPKQNPPPPKGDFLDLECLPQKVFLLVLAPAHLAQVPTTGTPGHLSPQSRAFVAASTKTPKSQFRV